ncbi:MAG: SMC-Scp complex subunit ScpB [Candidatus Taylorbacteria bacterium RIFCSPHIGHO2_02_FULL_45_28]|uniref:SMC-Scp complex subunit ScpB n=1 Tax=Candidatus Taylorbacteria bacterium RIFCSPHIGHO2_12_FULL_45_16 TaxID=1802315 RepID=A0A1G2MZK8_9BACT|nr:MAG: SMC-Scp complex subunit ScpB [Candidatus Taylorbacteria bacterium RIFCSPHIGHO2_01_FULL_44_110]OHA25592.1 MAG: SMC-Scp complex subunit ScpB [Candidatus Taylorbacteria bacterium RIFCSPHIGHO2_02_FULL_45_28]OHA29258.1 MAG: SMC-Scp complex subunit ScpB [Candidatus Taylorbacteria bacterium RIFCSPHIGHO2_12_FULL_45_16]OHA33480.1 MAG: SMC-Scp complex subunit ScpB [Candidatus Taylorbacteria bacterium RIFCSPLOWO2_01_FULL_45_59]OHA39190.1 MAG: SMC-Scp complex subunit ScpB [Candidatus Taylorbacteria
MHFPQQLEAILFWKAEPVSFKKLAALLNIDVETVKNGLDELENTLRGRGLTLVRTDEEAMLGTAKELSPLIEQLTKEELTKDLGKAGLETLSIILYQGPITRADIDYIRGVNSQFIVRNLLIRGLVERVENPKDARSFLYKTTLDLLSHLGISKIEELPEYAQVREDIDGFKRAQLDH